VPRHSKAAPDATDRPSVLIVDDSTDMRELLRDVLARAGWDARTAASGERALRLMRDQLPDAVIMDLFMPGMSGVELRAQMLRDSTMASIPVVVLSAYWRRPSETLEAFEVLPKPLSIDRLLGVMARLRTSGVPLQAEPESQAGAEAPIG
jgi:CheY-like chemotaxis protein